MTSDVRNAIEIAIERGVTPRLSANCRTGGARRGRPADPRRLRTVRRRRGRDPHAGRGRNGGGETDDLTFEPEQVTVKVGDTVTWRNTGTVAHTSTDDPSRAQDSANAVLPEGAEPWDSGDIAGGEEFSYTFDTPGDYTYFCIPHETAGMVARLTVTEA